MASSSSQSTRPHKNKEIWVLIPWLYDFLLWFLNIVLDLFFREIHPRGSWRVPRSGPVMFVAAPHANQFVDPLILMRVLRHEAGRRIANLIAAKSMSRPFIGTIAGWMGSIPVGRALDAAKPGTGMVYVDEHGDEMVLRGVGTDFEKEASVGGLVVLPTVNSSAAQAEVVEIISRDKLRLKKPFQGDDAKSQLSGKGEDGKVKGTKFKVAPKVDQTKVYDAVFQRLDSGGCCCIFPEGGSHDRPELLPLKPGVAIMALGSLAANPDSGLKIVPCGMNYFHAHKFRSRAVVEFGTPIEVPKHLIDMYRNGDRREATGRLLETIYQSLVAVTVQSPDYDTLMLIQAARRLYNPKGKKLPLPRIIELNRRMIKGYTHYKDDPRIINLKKNVMDYNAQLWQLGVRDHQVEYAKFSILKVVFALIYRLSKLFLMAVATLPGLVLFAPVFIACKLISIKKSREALAASTVKLEGRDVIATWKLLVALAFAPALYTFYIVIFTTWAWVNDVNGYIPSWFPFWAIPFVGSVVFPAITFAGFRIGEIGMDILKSIRPLVLSLNPTSANTLVRLRARRAELSIQVTDLINTLGPELYDDFDHARIISDPFKEGYFAESSRPPSRPRTPRTPSFLSSFPSFLLREDDDEKHDEANSTGTDSPVTSFHNTQFHRQKAGHGQSHDQLPDNDSFQNLSSMSMFATQPPSRSRSRSQSTGPGEKPGLKRFSTIDSVDSLDEVSSRIREAMKERGQLRRRRSGGEEREE